jgi:hypothetical protein
LPRLLTLSVIVAINRGQKKKKKKNLTSMMFWCALYIKRGALLNKKICALRTIL